MATPISRRLEGGRIRAVCADGKLIVAPCECGSPGCVCCSTGNQCVWWSEADETTGLPPAVVDHINATPYFDRLNGWTRLGLAFDIRAEFLEELVTTRYINDDSPDGFSLYTRVERLEYAHSIRVRLAPVGSSQAQLNALYGPATGPSGRWLRYPTTYTGIALFRYEYQGETLIPIPCMEMWMDLGGYTGERRVTNTFTPGSDVVVTVEDAFSWDLLGSTPRPDHLDQLLNFNLVPVKVQPWIVDPEGPVVLSPIQCDGLAWVGYSRTDQIVPRPNSGIAGFRYKWEDDPDPDQLLIEQISFQRVGSADSGAGTNGSPNNWPATSTCEHLIRHGEEAESDLTQTITVTPPGLDPEVTTYRRRIAHRLERISVCDEYKDLPPNDCTPPGWDNRIGRRCDDPLVTVVFDPTTRPDTDHITFLFGGERYFPTEQPSPLPAETVTWSTDPCPDDELPYGIAERCSNNASASQDPAEIPYPINPVLGAGNGSVRLTTIVANPSGGGFCVRITYYRPTTRRTADTPNERTLHLNEPACLYTSRTVCDNPDRPTPIGGPEWCGPDGICNNIPPDLPPELLGALLYFCSRACPPESEGMMAMGMGMGGGDPMAAQMRYFGGGCCG